MKIKLRKIDAVIIVLMIVIAGVVFYKVGYISEKKDENIPDIEFLKDDTNKTLTITSLSEKVLWDDIKIEGECEKSNLGRYIRVGDQITDCVGTITIRHKPTDTLLYTFKFAPTPKFPYSLLLGLLRDVSPQDEGVHFKKLANVREWWIYTVVFDENSELAGWSATIAFCHMAWGDLRGTFRPDLMVITLHSPKGKEYGGMINKQRKEILGLFGDPTLEAKSPGIDLKYEDSWALGEAPEWHVHAEDKDIDKENEIIMDLDFFAPSSPLWLHSNRLLDKGEGSIANYIFTGCQVTGKIILDGMEFEVKGVGHHEHSWSLGVLKYPIKGWDICHMTLDNGWNIYYSKYYLSREIISPKTTKVNPISSFIITTDQGDTLTILEDIDITVKSSDKLFLLLKMPSALRIVANPSISQILLKTYNIKCDVDIKAENTYEKTWKFPTYVGMKVGLNSVSGMITWSDENGDHEVKVDGLGTIWNMRKF